MNLYSSLQVCGWELSGIFLKEENTMECLKSIDIFIPSTYQVYAPSYLHIFVYLSGSG
jgi:hypothetical protein